MAKQAKTLNERELQKLLEFVSKTKNPKRNRAIFLLTFLSGLRIGEVAALRVCDVLASDGSIRSQFTLNPEQTKGNDSRTVLLSQRMQSELAAYVQSIRVRNVKQPLFATQRNEGFTASSLAQVVNGIYKKAGFDDCTSHSGRRSFATRASSLGISMRVLQKLMGHKNIQTTSVYIYASDDMLRNAVELI